MNLIPYKKYIIISDYPKDVVLNRLNSVTDKKKYFRINKTHFLFEGNITINYFMINRILEGRNSFAPNISGKFISEKPNSTIIAIEMRLSLYTTIFLAVVSIILIYFSKLIISGFFENKKFELFPIMVVLIFFVIIYSFTIFGFNSEVKTSKKLLDELLNR